MGSFHSSDSKAAYQLTGSHPEVAGSDLIILPPKYGEYGSLRDRTAFFADLSENCSKEGRSLLRATTLQDLMLVRACNSKLLQSFGSSLGTSLGLRVKGGALTDAPAVTVYTSRKVHKAWLMESQLLPYELRGPNGLWCDLDVVEFAEGTAAPRGECHSPLAEGLRGRSSTLGPGSQVATQEQYGTLSAIVQSRCDDRPLGFITNHHVSVDLDRPLQRVYHPLPPSLGPSIYLGTVERVLSYATDYLWYGMFAGPNPDAFVRGDGAFVRFPSNFDVRLLDPVLKGVGRIGLVMDVDTEKPVSDIVGKKVVKVGRTTGLTAGTIMAYAVEYNDDEGATVYTDFLILGEDGKPFDDHGDSGSLIVMPSDEEGGLPRPLGLVWGGSMKHGQLKLRKGKGPENWTSGTGLARLLDLLQVDLVTAAEEVLAARCSNVHPADGPLPLCMDLRLGDGVADWPSADGFSADAASGNGPSQDFALQAADIASRGSAAPQQGAKRAVDGSGQGCEASLAPDQKRRRERFDL